MSDELTEQDLLKTAQILARGLYFFEQLDSITIEDRLTHPHSVCDVAYQVRSLSEICSGMPLWLRSLKNIQALSAASLIDANHLLIKVLKRKKNDGNTLSDIENQILDAASDKYFALYYPDGQGRLKDTRDNDDCLNDTSAFTSKLLHQDEFSLFGPIDENSNQIGAYLRKLAVFWRKDFVAQCTLVNKLFPKIIANYQEKYKSLPFKLEIPFQ